MLAELLRASLAAFAMFFAVWIASVVKRDASLVDRFWGLAFVVIALAEIAQRRSTGGSGILAVVAVSAWGLRLSGYLTWRNWGRGEDRRYAAMRARAERSFAWTSLVTVFVVQTLLATVIALPIASLVFSTRPPGTVEYAGFVVSLLGLTFEAVADLQLARFLRVSTAGETLRGGLWAWSRHPNYFGEALFWVGLGIAGARGALGAWCLLGPLVLVFLLLRVSGVVLLERTIGERRSGYARYVEETSAFIPWPPRRAASAPTPSAPTSSSSG